MYSPSFIDEVYAKATEEAANCVRDFKEELEKAFNVLDEILADPY
jgi:hypothetical protein